MHLNRITQLIVVNNAHELLNKHDMHINPKKSNNSKWTALEPQNKEKHFIVIQSILSALIFAPIEEVELQSVYSGRRFILSWRNLTDKSQWLQGWL